jgi:uncharacterized protein YijF (DUF1287 family)
MVAPELPPVEPDAPAGASPEAPPAGGAAAGAAPGAGADVSVGVVGVVGVAAGAGAGAGVVAEGTAVGAVAAEGASDWRSGLSDAAALERLSAGLKATAMMSIAIPKAIPVVMPIAQARLDASTVRCSNTTKWRSCSGCHDEKSWKGCMILADSQGEGRPGGIDPQRAALVTIARMPSGPSTPARSPGSRFAPLLFAAALTGACEKSQAEPLRQRAPLEQAAEKPRAGSAGGARETSLGVVDRGIFSDLDAQVQIELPADRSRGAASAVVDRGRKLLVLYQRGWPVKVYPLGGPAELAVGPVRLALRPGDRAELAPLLDPARVRELAAGQAPPGDADGDGIPDPLDLLLGGHKNRLNAAPYTGGYTLIDYPGGDVPRDTGVCTDVIVRAARNAGLDLQVEVQREIRAAPRAFPMVKRPNANIDHRRVKTLLPYFERRWDRRRAALDDPADPLRPGDVVFMDTFASRPGPDHIGVVSDRRGPSGMPLVINSWTDGFRASEMDLLPVVPVTHRFRFPSRR